MIFMCAGASPKPPARSSNAGLKFRIACGCGQEDADAPHRLRPSRPDAAYAVQAAIFRLAPVPHARSTLLIPPGDLLVVRHATPFGFLPKCETAQTDYALRLISGATSSAPRRWRQLGWCAGYPQKC